MLRLLVGLRFHVLFHSPPGVLFTFPSRYWFTIGHTGVFSLTRWSSLIHPEFHVLQATRDSASILQLSTTGLSPSLVQVSSASSNLQIPCRCPTTPKCMHFGLGSSASLAATRESRLFSLPPATKMFQFAGFALTFLWIQKAVSRVAPFGNHRINACFQLPGAYRR